MKIPTGRDYFQFYSNRFEFALRKEEYHEALEAVIKGYLVAKDMGDDDCRQAFFDSLQILVSDFIEETFTRLTEEAEHGLCCSFCQRKANEVNIVTGWHGAICKKCAVQIYEHFMQEE